MRRQVRFVFTVAILCAIGVSCNKDNPVRPPTQPGHTAITFQVTFTSTRWCRLQWSNDSTAASHRYVLVRDNRDTLFSDSLAPSVSEKALQDTVLKPGTSYSYSIYRIVNGKHWDSANVAVRTLDTSSDMIQWDPIKRIGGGSIFGICSTGPGDVWMSCNSGIDSGSFQLIHLKDGKYSFFDTPVPTGNIGRCFARSDSDVWMAADGGLIHFNGQKAIYIGTANDSFPQAWAVEFKDVWESPSGSEIFAVGASGFILHCNAAGKWEKMESGTPVDLLSMRAFSNADIYVSGGNGFEGDLLHYDGTSWKLILRSVPPDSVVNTIQIPTVWGETSDSLFLACNHLYHRKANTWVDHMKDANPAYLEGVHSLSWNNVFACGDFGLLMHFSGEHWVLYNQFFDLSSDLVFNSVLINGNDVYVVGGSGTQGAYLLHGRQ